jgi:hypothetical protein
MWESVLPSVEMGLKSLEKVVMMVSIMEKLGNVHQFVHSLTVEIKKSTMEKPASLVPKIQESVLPFVETVLLSQEKPARIVQKI